MREKDLATGPLQRWGGPASFTDRTMRGRVRGVSGHGRCSPRPLGRCPARARTLGGRRRAVAAEPRARPVRPSERAERRSSRTVSAGSVSESPGRAVGSVAGISRGEPASRSAARALAIESALAAIRHAPIMIVAIASQAMVMRMKSIGDGVGEPAALSSHASARYLSRDIVVGPTSKPHAERYGARRAATRRARAAA